MADRETVVLVHGLWMHGVVMWLMKHRLERAGYAARAYSYPAVRATLTENAERLARYCRALTPGKVHLVAHSLGGLVALAAAARLPRESRGRIVLIGTPLADSFTGRHLENLPGGRWLLGRCMAQWLRASRREGPEDLDVGVIAGDVGIGMGRVIAPGLPPPHDGVVAVAETRVAGLRDHIVLHLSHTAMLGSRAVLRQVRAFLDHGAFIRA